MSSNKKNTGAFMAGTILGGLVGAGVALLYAPKSGEDTRMVIKEKSIELKDKAMETSDDLMHKAEEMANTTMKKIEETTEATRVRAQEFQTRGQAFLDEQRERFKDALDPGKQPVEIKEEVTVENGKEKPEPVA